MSGKVTRQDRVLTVEVPQWLDWRSVGLIFLLATLIFVLAIMLTSGNGDSSGEGLLVRLRNLSRLSTIEMKLSTVVKVVNPRTPFRDVNEELVYGVCGRVVAGIDLSKLEKKDVETDGRRVRIKLPPAEIFPVTLLLENDMRDVPRYKLEGKERWVEIHSTCEHTYKWEVPPLPGMKKTPELVAHAQEEALKAFAKTAEDSGIREMAQAEAKKQLEKLLHLAGYETVEFKIEQEIQSQPELP